MMTSTSANSQIFSQIFVEQSNDYFQSSQKLSEHVVEALNRYIRQNQLGDENHQNVLNYVAQVLLEEADTILIRWFPKYRCALIVKRNDGCNGATRMLTLVGLESYEMDVKFAWNAEFMQTCEATSFTACPIESIDDSSFSRFMEHFQEEYNHVIQQDRDKRLNRHKKLTPAFIELILKGAHMRLSGKDVLGIRDLQGGWSEVSHYSGGDWPLLNAVIEYITTSIPITPELISPSHHHRFVCYFQLCLLEKEMELYFNDIGSASNAILKCNINRVITMMTIIARKAVDEVLGVLPVNEIESRLQKLREKLSQKVLQHWERNTGKYQLNLRENLNVRQMSMKNFSYQSMTSLRASSANPSNSNRREAMMLARLNTEVVPLFGKDVFTGLTSYLSQLEKLPSSSELFLLSLATSTVQNVVYKVCANLSDTSYEVDFEEIDQLVKIYRKWNRKLIQLVCKIEANRMKSRMVVEMLSHEMLVMWSMFCLVHNTLKVEEQLLKRYAVPLKWTDVARLVFSQKNAQEAALKVSAYLKRNSIGQKLFHLSNQNATLEFAYKFASSSTYYEKLWTTEQEDAKERQTVHWRIVQRKKENIEKLRLELTDLESKRNKLLKKRRELDSDDEDDEHEIMRVDRSLKSTNTSIASIEETIRKERKPPDPVFQPLPKESRSSLTILFFLYIPKNLEVLARLAISAQQILRPVEDICKHTALDEKEIKSIDKLMQTYEQSASHWTAWLKYYNSKSRQSGRSLNVLHPYFTYTPPDENKVGPRDVMLFNSPEEGVWHPRDENPKLLWNGGGLNLDSRPVGFFNPFELVRSNVTIEYFTEKSLYKELQYVVTQYGELTERSRSNQGIAKQNEKPDTLNKPQWLTTSSLRAYPNQQLRKLCSSLADRNLKLDDPFVHTLIRQTLFQIGDVELKDDSVFPVWKTDLLEGEFCDVISMELKSLGLELAGKPSQHKCLLMLIEISRHVAQWSDACLEVLRDYLPIITGWIHECQEQMKVAAVGDVATLRAKMALFYHYAILCFSTGSLKQEEAGDLCKLLVQAQNETRFEDSTPYDNQLKTAVNMCCEMMSNRVMTLVSFAELNDGLMLTEAVRQICWETPEKLTWKNILEGGYKSCCFEADSISGYLYTINLSNGVVLINGRPLSSLPESILRHPLYKKTFGDRNFKICLENNVMKTAMPIKGRNYSFSMTGNCLTVIEKDTENQVELRLLDSLSLDEENSWGFELPIILKENYSHWYCENKKALLFRGHYFLERNIDFLMVFRNNEWKCFRIPSHKTSSVWDDYLNYRIEQPSAFFDQLMLSRSSTRNILEKFENGEYVHAYKAPQGAISFHYPRFDLEFNFIVDFARNVTLVYSRDYKGYILSPCQQLPDTLWGFNRYLVLEHAKSGKCDTKIIIPRGDVVTRNDEVLIETETDSGAKLAVYTYDVHPRFQCLLATSIHARIHLAHLYAACETLLPEERMKMCGSEVAMQLIRRSWTNQPLDLVDYAKLSKIPKSAISVPGLELLCYEVSCSTLQTQFLHTDKEPIADSNKMVFPTQSGTVYMHQRFPRNVRSSLTAEEEIRVLGGTRSRKERKRLVPENVPLTCATNCIERETDWADMFEKLLIPYINFENRTKNEFIFSRKTCNVENKKVLENSMLYAFMMENLEASHNAHFELEDMQLKDGFQKFCPSLVERVTRKRQELQSELFRALTEIPEECGSLAVSFRMFRSVNLYPLLTSEDLVRCAFDKNWIQNFNPFLSVSCLEATIHNIKLWLKLCVLEDKLARLTVLLQECNETQQNPGMGAELRLLQELQVCRTWSADEHPQWLAFEVVTQLQIRPIQYTIAKTMIEGVENGNLGPVTQLNMGEGKTRVILPMLAMYWRNSDRLVRFNFLTPLLHEAFEYMHNVLCASVIAIPVFHHPFNRDVKLTSDMSRACASSLKHCQKLGGVLVCAPEHRLSLKLKQQELKQAVALEVCKILREIDSFKYLDILDEVDEILRTKNKLIYAIGSQEQLASKGNRWNVLQGLLKVISSSSQIQEILAQPLVSQGQIGWRDGKFQEFRLLPGELFEGLRPQFLESLVRELVSNPPFELRWMKQLNVNLMAVLDYATKPEQSQLKCDIADPSCLDDVLALRGFLANGLLVHCLMKRNRVDYGVNRRRASAGKNKLMAVPFHACETPALRAEFGHPDCALMYTCLAYYYDGLTSVQVEQAFRTLFTLGESAQADIYGMWFALSFSGMDVAHQISLDCVQKLDLSNSVLVSLLVKYFSFNIYTINFWLNSIVFPVETMQFPHRLEATAWDIAHNSQNKVAGFSGTNDERIIMPSSLKWMEQYNLSLVSTDGKMLQLLLKANFEPLNVDEGENRWKAILDAVILKTEEESNSTHLTRAFIDAGALMAGATDNEEVALYLVERLGATYKGIIYFDLIKNGWWVRDKYGRAWPKHSSPIHERDGFVYFDESRTRGADMKLNINSRAVLTLGPQMCKDKLMQAAGRMRMLEHGQKLLIMATKDVSSKIKSLNNFEKAGQAIISPVHVLKWVMTNTVNNVAKWLPEWAIQGTQFIKKSEDPSLVLVPDMTKLDQMYAHELQEKPVLEVWQRKKKSVLPEGNGVTLTEWNANLLADIDDRMKDYGREFFTKIGSNVEEELERELEKEIEVEEEKQIEIPRKDARSEVDWDVFELARCSSVEDLRSVVSVETVESFLNNFINFKGIPLKSYRNPPSIEWPTIHGTTNFFQSCENEGLTSLVRLSAKKNKSLKSALAVSYNEYLRLVDNFLIFSNGDVLLISERETDKVLKFTWNYQMDNFAMMSFTYARRRLKNSNIKFQTPFVKEGQTVGAVKKFEVTDDILGALALFQGLVMFSDVEKSCLERMLASDWAKEVAPCFCAMRGLGFSYSRSDLEILCTHYDVD